MKIIRFDSVGGASGDMILGALVGLGADREALLRDLRSLGIGDFDINVAPFQSHGLTGVQASVRIPDAPAYHEHHDHDHDPHEHGHHHPHHSHEHGTAPSHGHAHDHGHGHGQHEHRAWSDIRALIAGSALPEAAKASSTAVFQALAEAEARIHGKSPETVHFHEVGAVDSIVDIVGSCLALHRLGVGGVAVGPLPLGHGTIACAHGVYPSPAPATLELLAGMAVTEVDEPFELVTPTGAALLRCWRSLDRVADGSQVLQSAYSFGHRQLRGRPNVLRATLLETAAPAAARDLCLVLESNLDDTTPELIGNLMERLLAAGALDVFSTPIQMKKQRPAVTLTALCRPGDREALLDLIFRESTTFGVREYLTERTVLDRRWRDIQTIQGKVRIKIGTWRGEDVTFAPEMADCIRLAAERHVPVRVVYEEAVRLARSSPAS